LEHLLQSFPASIEGNLDIIDGNVKNLRDIPVSKLQKILKKETHPLVSWKAFQKALQTFFAHFVHDQVILKIRHEFKTAKEFALAYPELLRNACKRQLLLLYIFKIPVALVEQYAVQPGRQLRILFELIDFL
jgi:hypothetical protein